MHRLRPATLLLAAICLSACASRGTVEVLPQAQKCANSVPAAARSSNYSEWLTSLRLRAARVADCMTAQGLVFDEVGLEKELQDEEWTRNSQALGGDPQMHLMLMEQRLRASPALWRYPG